MHVTRHIFQRKKIIKISSGFVAIDIQEGGKNENLCFLSTFFINFKTYLVLVVWVIKVNIIALVLLNKNKQRKVLFVIIGDR